MSAYFHGKQMEVINTLFISYLLTNLYLFSLLPVISLHYFTLLSLHKELGRGERFQQLL